MFFVEQRVPGWTGLAPHRQALTAVSEEHFKQTSRVCDEASHTHSGRHQKDTAHANNRKRSQFLPCFNTCGTQAFVGGGREA